jgi:hypothetical protein
MQIILNSITFAPLVQNLENNKCAHYFNKDFLVNRYTKSGTMGSMVWEAHNMVTPKQNKQTNKQLPYYMYIL